MSATSQSRTSPKSPPLIEARSIDWIPTDERHGRLWHQGPLWFLGNFQYFTIPIGFIGPSLGLSLGWTIVATILGIAAGSLVMALHASQGPHMGLPQMIQSRAQFGYRGVIVPLLAALIMYMAFNVIDTVLLGDGMQSAFGLNATAVGLAAALIAVVLAVFGHDWVHRAFRMLLYISLPLTSIVTIGIFTGAALGSHHPAVAHAHFTWAALLAQFTACAAYNITYAPYVSDYSRYLPENTTPRKVIASVFFGASGSALWLIAMGAWLATRLGATDGLAGLKLAGNNVFSGLGSVTAILSASALVATMGMNVYGASLTVLTGVDSFRSVRPNKVHRAVTISTLAVIWFAISEAVNAGAVTTLNDGLTIMLYLLVPWTATNLVDYFIVRRGQYAIADLLRPGGVYPTWNRYGLISYGLGFLAEIPFMMVAGYTGPVAKALGSVDISWLIGLLVSSVAYLLMTRSLDLAGEAAAVELRAHQSPSAPVNVMV